MTILKEAILITGCDENRSRNLFKSLKNMGLGLFAKERSHGEFDVLAFAVAKKVLTAEESEDIFEKREEKRKKTSRDMMRLRGNMRRYIVRIDPNGQNK